MKPRDETRDRTRALRTTQVALSLATLAAIVAVAALGLLVQHQIAVAIDGRLPLSARIAAARGAMRLRPFSGSAEVTYAILEGRRLFAEDATWDEAQELLYTTYLRAHRQQAATRRALRS